MQRLEEARRGDSQHERAQQRLEEEGGVVLRGSLGGEDFDLLSFFKVRGGFDVDDEADVSKSLPLLLGSKSTLNTGPSLHENKTG